MHKPCSTTIAAIRLRGARAIAVALLLAGAVTVLTYGLLAPVAAPQLAHLVFDRLAPRGGEWTAGAEAIRFEPFTLAFELHNVDVSNAAGDFHAEASLCRVDFSVTSLMLARARPAKHSAVCGKLRGVMTPARRAVTGEVTSG